MVHRRIDIDTGRIVTETNKSQSVLLLIKLQYNLHNNVARHMRCIRQSIELRDERYHKKKQCYDNGTSII